MAVGRRALPVLLVVIAAFADARGAHGLAFNALLGAIPFAAVSALTGFGEYLEHREDAVSGLQALLWTLASWLVLAMSGWCVLLAFDLHLPWHAAFFLLVAVTLAQALPASAGSVGVYELAPGFQLTLTREGDQLMGQPTGLPKAELFPESETKFFLKVEDTQIELQRGPVMAFICVDYPAGHHEWSAFRRGAMPRDRCDERRA